MKASVVIVTYRRKDRISDICQAWLSQSNDVWLCDCTKDGLGDSIKKEKENGLNYVRFSPDPGNKVRHAVATLTNGDIVIKADDDILPKSGLAGDFIRHMEKLGDSILGVHGRIFRGPKYYSNTSYFGAKSLEKAKRVHFVGVITCTPRKFLAMDLKGCKSEIEDLFWQMKFYPHVPKFVIKSDQFMNLPSCKDQGRLCASVGARKIRDDFYRQYYLKHYRKK